MEVFFSHEKMGMLKLRQVLRHSILFFKLSVAQGTFIAAVSPCDKRE